MFQHRLRGQPKISTVPSQQVTACTMHCCSRRAHHMHAYHVHVYVYIMYIYICMYVCMYTYIYIHKYIYVYIYITYMEHICMCIYNVCINTHTHIIVCIYIYTYMHTYIARFFISVIEYESERHSGVCDARTNNV